MSSSSSSFLFFGPRRRRRRHQLKWCLSSLFFVWFGAIVQVQQVASASALAEAGIGASSGSGSGSSSFVSRYVPKQLFVDPVSGNDTSTCGIHYDASCRTIGQAYDLAGPGDTILLAPGVYKDERDRDVGGRKERSRSSLHNSTNTNTNTNANTTKGFSKSELFIVALNSQEKPVIDLERSGLLFDLRHVAKITIRGLVIKNGSGKIMQDQGGTMNHTTRMTRVEGGCMRFEYAQDILLEDVDFIGCQADDAGKGEGGSLYIKNSMVIFSNCQFHGSRAYMGGVLFVTATGNESYETTMPYFMNCTFSNSSAYRGGVASVHMEGGEIPGQMRGQVTWEDCAFVESHATFGGAIDVGGFSVCSFQGCTFENASALASGGLMHLSGASQMVLRDSRARNSKAAAKGGSIHCADNSMVNILHMTFQNSTSQDSGGVLHSEGRSKVVLSQVVLSDAEAGGEGGAIKASGHSQVTLEAGHLWNARAKQGGGISTTEASCLYVRGSLFGNCSASRGGALYAKSNHTVEVRGSLFYESSASLGSAIYTSAADIGVHNCSFVNTRHFDLPVGGSNSSTSSVIYAEEGERDNLVESRACGFISTVLNISSPVFRQDDEELHRSGYSIFWDTPRNVHGICSYEDLRKSIEIDSTLLEEANKFTRFIATGPQAVEVLPTEVRPGTPFKLRLRVVDGFGQDLRGNHQGLRLRVRASDPLLTSFRNGSASFEDVLTYDGSILINDMVTTAPPETNLGLDIQSNLTALDNVRVNLTVGYCLPDQEYRLLVGSCLPLPPCSLAEEDNGGLFFTSQVESCSAQGTERRITYSWIHSEWERNSTSSVCSGKLSLPSEKKIGCWFVSVHSVAAKTILILSGAVLALHLVVFVFLVRYRSHRAVRLGQPRFGMLIILGNTTSLIYPFLSVGKPSGVSCMVGPYLISMGFSITLGSLLVKAQRLSDILRNKRLEKAKMLTRFTYFVLLVCVIDLALHLSLFLVWPTNTTRLTYRQEHQATIEESSCVSPSGNFILAILVCKILQVASGVRSGVHALKVAKLSHEARLAGRVLLELLTAVVVALGITQLVWLTPRAKYAVICSCILFWTMLSLTCVVLPSLLLAILQSRASRRDTETFSLHFPSWESLFFTAFSKFKEFEGAGRAEPGPEPEPGPVDPYAKDQEAQDPSPVSADAHIIHVIANQTR